MIQRFFFNGVDTVAAGATVAGEDDFSIAVGAHKTQSLLAFVQLAGAWTDITHDATVIKVVPVTGCCYTVFQ